jgi:hypothetical protein
MVRVLSTSLADANQKLVANRSLIRKLTNGVKRRLAVGGSRALE